MRESLLLRYFVYITSFLSSVSAFSVTFSTPTQCDPFTVSWSGGQAPFEILLTPRFSPLVNQSVPSSAFTNGKGTYTIPQLPFMNGTQFALTMSDGTGFGSGGTTTLLNVGLPVQNNNCNTKLTQDFYFSLPSQLKQCAYFNFTNYAGAIQPVTIGILIPGGDPTAFSVPNGSYYSWMADVTEGTSLLFFMVDSQGRQGGVSDLELVADSTDASCLVAGAPSSTATVASTPTSSQTTFASSSSTSNAGVIAGATVGSVAFVALLIILGLCWRRRSHRASKVDTYPVQLPRTDDDQEAKGHGQTFPSQYQTDHPGNLANVPASEPFARLRQMSYADSYAGSSSVSSASRLMPGMAGPVSPHTFAHQTLPTGLSPPSVASNDPTPYSQMQPSGQVSNQAAFAGYGNTVNSSVSPASRRMPTLGEHTITPNYSFPYQAPFSSYLSPPGTVPHRTSPGTSDVSNPSSPTYLMQPPHLDSNIERFGRPADAGNTSPGTQTSPSTDHSTVHHPTQIIMHTDVDDLPVSDIKSVEELPPQYTNRNLPNTPPARS